MTLLLFTLNYPYRNFTEEVFVRQELESLSGQFDRVVILPRFVGKELLSVDVPGVEVDLSLARHPYSRCKALRLPWLLRPSVMRGLSDMRTDVHGMGDAVRAVSYAMNLAVFASVLRGIVRRYEKEDGADPLLYSYWFDLIPDALVAAFGREKCITTRAHRYDVFDDQVPFRSRVMRARALSGLRSVFAVSEHGLRYMAGRYPDYAEKIELATLGSRRDDSVVAGFSDEGAITLLSVSRVVSVKRVDRCLDMAVRLAETYPWIKIKWIHVGDGPLMSLLKGMLSPPGGLPSNLEVDLRGAMPNEEVHRIYHNEPVDWFMLFSESEGLPIAVCEALSYGVPVLATDVGGIAEAVNADSGIVLGQEASADDFVGEMQPYVMSRMDYIALRDSARARWESGFDAVSHAMSFALRLKSLKIQFDADR